MQSLKVHPLIACPPRPYLDKTSYLLRTSDAVCVVGGLYLSFGYYGVAWEGGHTLAAVVAVLLFQVIAGSQGLYRPWQIGRAVTELLTVALSWSLVVPALVLLALGLHPSHPDSRVALLCWLLLSPVALALCRRLLRFALTEFGALRTSVAIAGASALGARLARSFQQAPWSGVRVEGFYDDRARERLDSSVGSVRGNLSDLVERVNEVVECVFGLFRLVGLTLRNADRHSHRVAAGEDELFVAFQGGDFDG